MTATSWNSLEMVIGAALGNDQVRVVSAHSCSGGCIHQAQIVELNDGSRLFVKSGLNAGDMFAQEALGLAALDEVGALRIPRVVGTGMLSGEQACLVLEAIESARPASNFWQIFGRQFAELHRTAVAAEFGWSSDNYLGSSRQINSSKPTWVAFVAERRLGYQLKMARQRGLGSHELFKRVEQLIGNLDKLLATCQDPPSLLHGDLWSGNYLVDENGGPTLIDPAVSFGQREADLAMPLLFGGFPPEFFDAYQEAWPLDSGWRERVEIYKLYHLLNHLNLFGSGYLESCLEIARKF